MIIHPAWAEVFQPDRRTDFPTDSLNNANRHFWFSCQCL